MNQDIKQGNLSLGIELGSTRIKAVLLNRNRQILATGSFDWENSLQNGIWTYSMDEVMVGVQTAYQRLAKQVENTHHCSLTKIKHIGISGMMHGYLAFDQNHNLLVPFRTWRNSMTADAVSMLNLLLHFNIPQRYSIAHLVHAVMQQEEHLTQIDFFTTLAGYVHFKLTGEKILGIGDASGMFPIDSDTKTYREDLLSLTQQKLSEYGFHKPLSNLLPKVRSAGEFAGVLTDEGAKFLDISGRLEAGSIFCPPEGDAGTGMIATNSITKRKGNVSAGTSIFAMIVLEKNLSKMYEEVDIVTTPAGDTVAMIHANNCTTEINAWVKLFQEFSALSGHPLSSPECFSLLFKEAMHGKSNCDSVITYGFHSGEDIVHAPIGRPLLLRLPGSDFNIANVMRSLILSAFSTLAIGMETLYKEGVVVDSLLAHGGIFKTPKVAQSLLAAALNTPISVTDTAGEGGAFGIAILADYMNHTDLTLEQYLQEMVYNDSVLSTLHPSQEDIEGFADYLEKYKSGLRVEMEATKALS